MSGTVDNHNKPRPAANNATATGDLADSMNATMSTARRTVGAKRQRQHEHREYRGSHEPQCAGPTVRADKRLPDRREQKLPDTAGRCRYAERGGTPRGRHETAEGRDHDRKSGAGECEADEHTGGELKTERRGTERHEGETERIVERTNRNHAAAAEAIRQCAGGRLGETPHEMPDRDRKREHVTAPAARLTYRIGEQPERAAWSEDQDRDTAGGGQNHVRVIQQTANVT